MFTISFWFMLYMHCISERVIEQDVDVMNGADIATVNLGKVMGL